MDLKRIFKFKLKQIVGIGARNKCLGEHIPYISIHNSHIETKFIYCVLVWITNVLVQHFTVFFFLFCFSAHFDLDIDPFCCSTQRFPYILH